MIRGGETLLQEIWELETKDWYVHQIVHVGGDVFIVVFYKNDDLEGLFPS